MKRKYKRKTAMAFFRRKSIAFFMATLMVLPQFSYAVSSNPVSSSGVRPGAMSSGRVDLASGNLAFMKNLFDLKGYKLTLKYNTEGLKDEVSIRNHEAPTGVVGVGWKFSKDRIVRLTHQTANTTDDEYLLNAHGKVSKLTFEYEANDTIHFRLHSNPYWRILFLEAKDQWIIQKQTGKEYIYGDGKEGQSLIDHDAGSTESSIVWDNWIGSSVATGNRQKLSVAWNLSAIENKYGERVELFYDRIWESVGGNTSLAKYTKASYLTKVVDMDGNYIQLKYREKDSYEYRDPHRENTIDSEQFNHGVAAPDSYSNNDKDAFQERFETKYLSSVERYSFADVLDRKIEFRYALMGSEFMKKRYLTEIQYLNKDNVDYQPSTKYDYYGSDESDGVYTGLKYEDTKMFNPDNGALYGAIKGITIPGGGTYLYTYDKLEIANSSLDFDIPFPDHVSYTDENGSKVSVGWKAPKLFFMNDYVVVLHETNDYDLIKTNVSVCTWIGDRWVYQDFGDFYGYYYDRYHLEDYHEKNLISSLKNALLTGISENVPLVGGLMNAFNDAITDDINMNYYAAIDLQKGDVKGAIKELMKGTDKIIKDIVDDIVANLKSTFDDFGDTVTDMFGHKTHKQEQKQLAEEAEKYNAKNPRKEYHITLQKDFFALTSSFADKSSGVNDQNAYIFEKDRLVEGNWGMSAIPVFVTSKYITIDSGNDFVVVFDELSDVFFTMTRHRHRKWYADFYRINQVLTDAERVKVSAITANAVNDILQAFGDYSEDDQDYLNLLSSNKRSAIAANNNYIIVATSQADGSNARLQMFHHNKNKDWNWSHPATQEFDKTLIPEDVAGSMSWIADGLAANSLLQLKTGNSIAALQVYDNLDTEAYNDVMSLAFGGVGTTDGSSNPLNPLSTLQNDLVQDMSAMNATYGIVWNKDMSEIDVKLLHAAVGQTGIKMYVNGNVIHKIGKAYSLLIGAQKYDDNGINYAFRYDGEKFISASFESDYFSTAMAPDVASQVVESSDKAYKTPKFRQFYANRPVHGGDFTTVSTMGQAGVTLGGTDLSSYNSAEMLANVPSSDSWSLIDNVSHERINAPEFVKEAIHFATDLVNFIIQVIMMIIPFAQEFAIAEEVISVIDKIVQVAGMALMVVQPAADALVDRVLGVNHKSTSIANNYISVNGKLFARWTDGQWEELGHAFDMGGNDELVGTTNDISNGYYNYTVKKASGSQRIQSHLAILKNGQIYRSLPFNQRSGGDLMIARRDSLTLTGGNKAFVSYGPINDDGYVKKNNAIIRPDAQNAEERRRKQSYEDAKHIRLHRIAEDNATGKLHDYVVKMVESNTGYESTYEHYHYDAETASHNDAHGATVYPKVTLIPKNTKEYNQYLIPFGAYQYYFFNNQNFYGDGSHAKGYPKMFRDYTKSTTNSHPDNLKFPSLDSLVTYSSFDHRDTEDFNTRGIIPMNGRQYLKVILDKYWNVKSRSMDCHVLFAHDFFHRGSIIELDHVYQPLSSVKISELDGVVHRTVNKYTDEYRATLLRTVERHSTTAKGEPEIFYSTKRYSFEHYPDLIKQNRLSEVYLQVDSVKRGDQVYVTGAHATNYKEWEINGKTIWDAENTYSANLPEDILDPSVENYQVRGAENMTKQDSAYAVLDALIAAFEYEIGNYDVAVDAVIGANKAAVESYRELAVTREEIINAQHEIQQSVFDLDESNQELAQAKKEMDDAKANYDELETEYKESLKEVDKKHREWQAQVDEKKWAVPLAFAASWIAGIIVEKKESHKVNEKRKAWEKAKATAESKENAAITAKDVYQSTLDVYNSLSAQHDAIVAAINLANIELKNTVLAFENSYDNSSAAKEAAMTAIEITSVTNRDLTHRVHNVSVTNQDTAILMHSDYKIAADDAIEALQNIVDVAENTKDKVYDAIIEDAKNAIADIQQTKAYHDTHIGNLGDLKDQHFDVMDKVRTLSVKADDIDGYKGIVATWFNSHSILQRDEHTGAPLTTSDARQISTSHLTDKEGRFIIASSVNSDLNDHEAIYFGFEEYEEFDKLRLSYNQGIYADLRDDPLLIMDHQVHTGKRAFRAMSNQMKLQPAHFNPHALLSYADTAYVVSAFVKKKPYSKVWVGADTLQYQYAPEQAKAKESENWQYIEGVVIGSELTQGKTPTIHISGSGGEVYIDDVAIRPLASQFEATIYNDLGLPVAEINNNGLTKRMHYDSHNQLSTVIDDTGRIYGLNATAYSRDHSEDGEFDPMQPNESTQFSFIDFGKVNTFDASQKYRGGFNVDMGSTALLDENGLPNFEAMYRDMLFSFSIVPQGDEYSFDFKLGNDIFIRSLDMRNGVIESMGIEATPFQMDEKSVDFTVAILDMQLLLWLNGKLLAHHYLTDQSTYDSFVWDLSNAHMAENIITAKNPVFQTSYTNGIGQLIQTSRPLFATSGILLGQIIKSMLYDGWGHLSVSTLPMFVFGSQMKYRPNAIRFFNWDSGEMQGEISDYYASTSRVIDKRPNDYKYPYFRTYYADYPISRVVKSNKAGQDFYEQDGNATKTDYQSREGEFAFLLGMENEDYNTQTKTSSLGTKTVSVKDKMGREIISQKGNAKSQKIHGFSTAGFMSDTLRSPNFFAGSRQGMYYTSVHAQEDLLSLSDVNISPDRGRVEMIKDQTAKVAFVKAASSTATEDLYGQIKYYRYDEQERVIEQGIYSARWDKQRLSTMSKSPFWFDNEMYWTKLYVYDIDADQNSLYNKGRTTKTVHKNGDYFVESEFDYNIYGQMVKNTLTLTDHKHELQGVYEVKYDYYPTGQIKKITYPNGYEVLYHFNRQGKLGLIGTAEDPMLYASYEYDELDRLMFEGRNNNRLMSVNQYDLRGRNKKTDWMKDRNDTIFTQELEFFKGTKYYDTKISQIRYGGSAYSDIKYKFEYDQQDRLKKSSKTMNEGGTLESNSSVTYSFDSNSNIRSYHDSSKEQGTVSFDYEKGTNQDRMKGFNPYNADGLRYKFDSKLWGDMTYIAYNPFSNKTQLIYQGDDDYIIPVNRATWYKLAPASNHTEVMAVQNVRKLETLEGDRIISELPKNLDSQLFRFVKSKYEGFNTYNLKVRSNEELNVCYNREERTLYLGKPKVGEENGLDEFFLIKADNGNLILTNAKDYSNAFLTSKDSSGVHIITAEILPGYDEAQERASFRLLPVDIAKPSNEFMMYHYDAKNNKVMKTRKFKGKDHIIKQDTLVYVHGNNRLPLAEFNTGFSIQGDTIRHNYISNYIYGPGFGSIGMVTTDIAGTLGFEQSYTQTDNGTYLLPPTADTYIRFSSYSSANYGGDPYMAAKKDEEEGYTRHCILKFDVSSLPMAATFSPSSSVKLRLYVRSNEDVAEVASEYQVSILSNDWQENEITANDIPALNKQGIKVVSGDQNDSYWEIDLTDVKHMLFGNPELSLLIEGLHNGNAKLMSTKEEADPNKHPVLIIENQ